MYNNIKNSKISTDKCGTRSNSNISRLVISTVPGDVTIYTVPPKLPKLVHTKLVCNEIWILQHINCVFLMKNRIHIQNSRRNHLLSLFLQFGTLSVKWISHIHLMDLSYSCVLFLHYSNLQLCQVDLKWSCTWKCTLLGSQSYKSQRKEDSAKRFFSKLGEESSFWMKSSYV